MNPNEQGSTSLTKGKLLRVQTVPPCNLGKGHCAGLALFFSPLGPMCHGQCLRRLSAPDCITWAPLTIDLGSAPGRPEKESELAEGEVGPVLLLPPCLGLHLWLGLQLSTPPPPVGKEARAPGVTGFRKLHFFLGSGV